MINTVTLTRLDLLIRIPGPDMELCGSPECLGHTWLFVHERWVSMRQHMVIFFPAKMVIYLGKWWAVQQKWSCIQQKWWLFMIFSNKSGEWIIKQKLWFIHKKLWFIQQGWWLTDEFENGNGIQNLDMSTGFNISMDRLIKAKSCSDLQHQHHSVGRSNNTRGTKGTTQWAMGDEWNSPVLRPRRGESGCGPWQRGRCGALSTDTDAVAGGLKDHPKWWSLKSGRSPIPRVLPVISGLSTYLTTKTKWNTLQVGHHSGRSGDFGNKEWVSTSAGMSWCRIRTDFVSWSWDNFGHLRYMARNSRFKSQSYSWTWIRGLGWAANVY